MARRSADAPLSRSSTWAARHAGRRRGPTGRRTVALRPSAASTIKALAESGHDRPAGTPAPLRQTLAISAAVLIVLGAFGGLFVMISGIVPIKASSGHWGSPKHPLFREAPLGGPHDRREGPPLDRPGMTIVGAGQYGFACEPCIEVQPSSSARRGTHDAGSPRICEIIPTYDPHISSYIVKHGINLQECPLARTRARR